MPKVNPSATKAGGIAGGRRSVQYVDIKGRTHDAIVTGGSGANLDLRVPHLPAASRLKTAVAKRTTLAQTNVWF